jgi:short-subunit dehydrogenase
MNEEQRIVWITGASSGIGEAVARGFARRGDGLALSARGPDRLEAVAEDLRARSPGLEVLTLPMDVTEADQVEYAYGQISRVFGRVDVLVANAGVGVMDFLEGLEPEQGIAAQIDTNLSGAILVTRNVLQGMKQRRSGHILLVASLASWIGVPGYSVYTASKFGVRGFAEALRREVRPWGINVSVIYPGPVANAFGTKPEALRAMNPPRPPGFVLTSEQAAEAIVRLADHPRRSLVVPARYLPAVWLNLLLPGVLDLAMAFYYRCRARGSA